MIEKGNVGGTCINTGCTPTKTMVHRAQIAHYARNASRWGVRAENVAADLPTIVAQKNNVVASFRGGIQKKIGLHPNIHLYQGQARFTNAHQVRVGDTLLESEKIFINTGGRPNIPDIPGLDPASVLTNESMMELTELPEHLIILGGGYIGLEFGQMFRRFGSRVTIIHNQAQIVPREDPEIAAELQKILEGEGIEFHLNAQTTRVEQTKGSVKVTRRRRAWTMTISGTHLLAAVGRRPNTDDLGLDKAGVETDKSGFIRVNSRLETNVPGIWALGDVKGGPAFTHISFNDFQIVDANLTQGKNLTIENRIVPYCVFTDPQLGGVGMTEKEARAAGHKLKIGKIPMSYVARAIERDETAGLMKVIVDAANDRILGATILACEGGELVHVLYTLMLGNLPYTVLKGAVFIHPTLTEGFFALAGQRETGGLIAMRKEQANAPLRIRRLRRSELPIDTIALARYLIGKTLVHDLPRVRLAGRIVETEAYPVGDAAGHAFGGLTPSRRSLFLPHGHAYVYFTYGSCFMMNVSSEEAGTGAGVLVRAVEPLEGIRFMQRRRGTTRLLDLARGPGRLAQAMDINKRYDGVNLCAARQIVARSRGSSHRPNWRLHSNRHHARRSPAVPILRTRQPLRQRSESVCESESA